MTSNNEYRFLRKLYKDIILGYSYIDSEKIYIKHPTELELGLVEDFYIQYFNEAKINGLPDESDKIKELCEAEMWSYEKEKAISFNKKQISNLNETLKKIFISSQVKSIKNQILNIEKELNLIFVEREELLGITAEKYAAKRSNEIIIYKSIFKDQELSELFFSEDSFEEIDARELSKYVVVYNAITNNFHTKYIKKIAALPFFLNSFFLTESNSYEFYGKPIVQLSTYQQELISCGISYKNVLTKGVSPREEYYDSLDELVAWYDLNKNIGSASDVKYRSKNIDGATYIGASKDEIKLINRFDEKDEIIDISKEADKKGGELNMEDIVKLHGL